MPLDDMDRRPFRIRGRTPVEAAERFQGVKIRLSRVGLVRRVRDEADGRPHAATRGPAIVPRRFRDVRAEVRSERGFERAIEPLVWPPRDVQCLVRVRVSETVDPDRHRALIDLLVPRILTAASGSRDDSRQPPVRRTL
jgi:hypothetical protein